MEPWSCDGEPKNGKQYPNGTGPHEAYENYGPDCVICGLPREAMIPKTKITKTQFVGTNQSKWLIPAAIAGLLLLGGAGIWYLFGRETENLVIEPTTSPTTAPTTSPTTTAVAANLLSAGEDILLDPNTYKTAGATAYSAQNWTEALTQYQQAVDNDPNDPESQIYLNNAKARQQGNPLVIAVAVPIDASPNSAKEILRGVAQYQAEFNQSQGARLLEVVIVNQQVNNPTQASPLAQEIINNPEILGILGYGSDPGSKQAIQTYEDQQFPVLSPINTQMSGATLKLIPLSQTSNKLLEDYLESAAKTLLEKAKIEKGNPQVIIFYNADSAYSTQLKQAIIDNLPQVNGQLVKEVDINSAGFDPSAQLSSAATGNTIILALSKNKISEAIAIASANQKLASPLLLMGGDELYTPEILTQGGDEITGIILAVPWSSKAGDTFATEAASMWKGRVSWRTTTAYDATKALVDLISQNPDRNAAYQSLQQGITLTTSQVDFNIFSEVPLVQAVPGGSLPGATQDFKPL